MEFLSLLTFIVRTRNLENTGVFYNYDIITVLYTKYAVIYMYIIKYGNL